MAAMGTPVLGLIVTFLPEQWTRRIRLEWLWGGSCVCVR